MYSRSKLTALVLFVASWLFVSSARAALDPELSQPYRIQVVLHFSDHRLLTNVFKDQVERELRDGLRAAFGDLAEVEVVREHPKLEGVEEKGLGPILDGWKDVNDIKTHFILLDYVAGQYELTARQHDGYTGQASPMVRRERTPDRQFVTRTAALLINRDLGLVGTVIDKGEQVVKVGLRGAALKVPLDRWVKKGDVFAIAQVRQGAGGLKGVRVPWALLQVQEGPDAAGTLTCRLFNRHAKPLDEGPGVIGFRCVKLDTTKGPLRLRLMDATAKVPTPKPNQQVHVRRYGFTAEDGQRVEGATDADGYFSTERAGDRGVFDNVAFISVLSDNQVRVQVPVPIHDDRPVSVAVNIQQEAGLQLTVRRDLWERQIYEGLLVLADLFREMEKLLAKPGQKQMALDAADAAATRLRDDLLRFGQMREKLLEDAKEMKAEDKLILKDGDQRLKELTAGRDKLQKFIAGLRRVLAEENDPKRKDAKEKLARAQLLEDEANYDQALGLYKEVIDSKLFDDAELSKRYESLKKSWEPKNDKHAAAREFIVKTWPTLELSKLAGSMKEVREALETCKANDDALTPRKFLFVTVGLVGKLKEQLATLDPDNNEDDRNVAKRIDELTDDLNRLVREVSDSLEKKGK
jgi:hypothetical protein